MRRAALAVALALLAPLAASADLIRETKFFPAESKPRKSLTIPETREAPVIDGKLTDPAWGKAAKLTGFAQCPSRLPDPRETQVLLMYDAQNLYVGMRCAGDNLQTLDLRPQKTPDVWGGHMVELWLDPTASGRQGLYQFCLNAIGTRYDASPDGEDWQGKWQGRGSVDKTWWEVEFAIPFAELGVKGTPTGWPWLANFGRGGTVGALASWTGGWDEPGAMAWMFFGNDQAWRTRRPAALSILLDREEYDPLDVTGVAVVKLEPGPLALKETRLRMQVVGPGGVALEQEVNDLSNTAVDLTLNLAELPPGRYAAVATLLDKAGQALARAEAPLRKKVKRAAPPARGQVPLTVWPVNAAGLGEWPILAGVPFPQGALLSEKNVRLLDAQGREVPCQTIARSAWNRRGSVRWLGLDFQAALDPKGSRYLLEFGPEVRRAPVADPIQISETDERISVDTGDLKFSVRKRGFNLLEEVRLGLRTVSKQEKTDGLLVVDSGGAVYRASNDPNAEVAVEEAGPLRVTIRAAGWYAKDNAQALAPLPAPPADRLGQFVTRITAFRGKPYVAVQHAFVVTHDTRRGSLRNIAIGQRMVNARSGSFGLDGQAVDLPRLGGSVRLYQAASDAAQVETGAAATPQLLQAGRRADGWCRMAALGAGMTLCLTDPWQLFPKEIELADGALWLHLWPKHGRPYARVDPTAPGEIYKLWWCHSGETLNFTMPEAVQRALLSSPLAAGEGLTQVENGAIANAQGVAFENNFLLAFDSGDGAGPAAQNAVWQLQPHAWADPQWVCDSQVFGPMTPRDEERFPGAERFIDFAVFSRLAAQEYARDYGQFNYFDLHGDNSAFSKGTWGLNRVWNQGHHGSARIPWCLYARSGDPRYLALARRLSRHVMNVDVTHYAVPGYDLFQGLTRPNHPALDHRKGAMFHVKGFTHWGGDSSPAGHFVNFDFMLWDYYVTGNRRGLEVTREWMDGLKELDPPGYPGREGTQMIAELTELYKGTFDPQVLELLDRFARRIGHEGPFEQQFVLNFAPFLERYLPFTGSELFRRKALEWGDPAPNILATLYAETGDKAWLERGIRPLFFRTLHADPRPPAITPASYCAPWHSVSYDIQYMQPYLRALADAGLPLRVDGCPQQRVPGGARLYVYEEKDGEFTLQFHYLAKARALEIRLFNPRGKPVGALTLPNGQADPATEKLVVPLDLETGTYRVELGAPDAPADSETGVLLPITPLPTACVLAPGATGRFFGEQIWYFRAAPGQTTLDLDIPALGREGGVQVVTGDGQRILDQAGFVGNPAALQVPVAPGELYRLLSTQVGGSPNLILPRRFPLVLSQTPDARFAPEP